MLHYDKYETYSEAEKFVNRIISKLYASNDELLHKVADSYKKWKVGIINGLVRNQTDRRYYNVIAESNNSHIQRVINVLMVIVILRDLELELCLYFRIKKESDVSAKIHHFRFESFVGIAFRLHPRPP